MRQLVQVLIFLPPRRHIIRSGELPLKDVVEMSHALRQKTTNEGATNKKSLAQTTVF